MRNCGFPAQRCRRAGTSRESDPYTWIMRKREYQWQVIRLKPSPAVFVGIVEAPDEASAKSQAIKQFDIRPEDRDRLLVRRHG